MPSTITAVFFIFLQLSSQQIGCFAECRPGQESNLWDAIKEAVSKAKELLMCGMKIVGYTVDALMCAGGWTVIDTIKEVFKEKSIVEILLYSVKTVILAVATNMGLPFLLPLFGFGSGGIAAGSVAAWFQSVWFGGTIGGIIGCIFSTLQSIGATGLRAAAMALITLFSGVAVGLYEWLF